MSPPARRLRADELKQFLLARLPAWQVPRKWWLVDSLSANQRGKLSRAEWRKRFMESGTGKNAVDKRLGGRQDGRTIGGPTGTVGHGINRKVKIGSMRKTTLLAIGITALAVWLGRFPLQHGSGESLPRNAPSLR